MNFNAFQGGEAGNSSARKLIHQVNRSKLCEIRSFHLIAITSKHLSSHTCVASQFGTTSDN